MDINLLDLLVCPACLPAQVSLNLEEPAQMLQGDVRQGRLRCGACGTTYPVQDGLAKILPGASTFPQDQAKYDTSWVLGTYLWSSFGDWAGEPEASSAYAQWAAMAPSGSGPALDAGCGVGRSTLELAAVRGFAVGLDLSETFLRAARSLARNGRLVGRVREQGRITRPLEVVLPERLREVRVEFILADAMALPFRTDGFPAAMSLNLLDKLTDPLAHVRELDRVLTRENAVLILADPFSWSEAIAPPNRWLGGVEEGPWSGLSEEVLPAVLAGVQSHVRFPFTIQKHQPVSWVIRNHRNHAEHILSQTFRAVR